MMSKAQEIISRLKGAKIFYDTKLYRPDGVSILARTPGQYWEIDVLEDGSVDFEIFEWKSMNKEAELNAAIDDVLRYEQKMEQKTCP